MPRKRQQLSVRARGQTLTFWSQGCHPALMTSEDPRYLNWPQQKSARDNGHARSSSNYLDANSSMLLVVVILTVVTVLDEVCVRKRFFLCH